MTRASASLPVLLAVLGAACAGRTEADREGAGPAAAAEPAAVAARPPVALTPADKVAAAAAGQVGRTVRYDPSYARLAYPGGDVPEDRGVCTDVVIRALRASGVDLQVLVHEDMARAFDRYPNHWGLKKPDPNIDHRRVPNLARFFERRGCAHPRSRDAADYRAGDIVAWKLSNGRDHVGVVVAERSRDGQRPMVVHNIGAGARCEDVLFAWTVVGHYRYFDN